MQLGQANASLSFAAWVGVHLLGAPTNNGALLPDFPVTTCMLLENQRHFIEKPWIM